MTSGHRMRRREIRHQVLGALKEHLARDPATPLETGDLHPADIADVLWLDFPPEDSRRLFSALDPETAAEVLAEAEDQLVQQLLEEADPSRLASILREMQADDGADVLEALPVESRQDVLRLLEPEQAQDLRHLGAYEADTAGGLMTTEFMACEPAERVGDVLKRIKRDEGESETIHNLYVVSRRGMLEGVVSTRELLEAGIHDAMRDVMNPDVIKAGLDDDQEEVAHRILHYNLSAIPVVDQAGMLRGIVTADDALEVVQEEASEDAYLLAGASSASAPSDPLLTRVMHRAPMLVVTVLGGLAMSRVMAVWTHTGQAVAGGSWAVLIPYIPMVLGLAGNVGQQTSAVAVRGFATGYLAPGRRLSFLAAEVQVGAVLGLMSAVVAGPLAGLLSGSVAVGTSVAVALFFAMTWTTTASCSIAVGSHAAGLDPALVSGPVMTAVSDLSAVMVFFAIASVFLDLH